MPVFISVLLRKSLPLLIAVGAAGVVWGADAPPKDQAAVVPQETPEQHNAKMAWWREARFGMFIHWGLYSQLAGEYGGKTGYAEWIQEQAKIKMSEYASYAPKFDPEKFDAKEWVAIAKRAGMKYLVITSKHHDGFDMWPAASGDWGIKLTPFKRDPLKELSEACKEAGIRFCVYYSIMDWHSSDWGKRRAWNDVATGTPDMDRYVEYMKAQLKELVENYHPGLIWFDGEWEAPWTQERGAEIVKFLHQLDPNLIVNNRIGKKRVNKDGMDNTASLGDYGTPEQRIPPKGFGPGVDWETCMTINGHWGYNSHDKKFKSAETLIRNLCDIASKGGNYLLNVGPTGEGVIPQPEIDCLQEMGDWLKVNGEAIYGTTAGPFNQQLPFGRATQKPGKLYLEVFDWPIDAKLTVPITSKVSKAYTLASPDLELTTTATPQGLVIDVPTATPDPIASVIVLEVAEPVTPLAPPATSPAK